MNLWKKLHIGINSAELIFLIPLLNILNRLDKRYYHMFGIEVTPFTGWRETVEAEIDTALCEICLDASDIRK